MSVKERQLSVVERFSQFDDWEERYREIIKLGRELDVLPEELKIEKYKVKGCQSQVWLHAELQGGQIIFRADSDAMIVRGLIAMLLSIYSGATPGEILENPPAFIGEIKLDSHLSPTRTNGLYSMVEQMMYYATAFKTLLAARGGN